MLRDVSPFLADGLFIGRDRDTPRPPARSPISDTSALLFAGHSFDQTAYGQPDGEPVSFGGILQTDWPGATLSDYQAYASMQQIWDLNGNLRNGEYDVAIVTEFTSDFTNGFPPVDSDETRTSLQFLYWAGLKARERGAELVLQDVWSPQGSDLRANVHAWFQFARQWLTDKLGQPVYIIPASPYVMAMRDLYGDAIYEDGLHLLKSGPYPRGMSYLVYSMLTQQRCPFVRPGDEELDQLAWNTVRLWEPSGMGGTERYTAAAGVDPLPNPLPLPPTLTVTNGIITPFSRDGVDYTEILWQQSGSFELSGDVTGNLALAAGGANGGLSTAGWVPGGGGAGQLIERIDRLFAAGSYSVSIGAGAPRAWKAGGAGVASNGSPSKLVCPDETLDALGGGKGGQSGSTNGSNGGNGGGASAGGSTTGLPGSGALGGFPGGAATPNTDVQQRSAGGGGGADGPGGDGSPSLGGLGGLGRLLSWIANPIEVCRGGKGHRTVSPVSSPDETWGNGSGGCYYGADEQYAGAGGDGFMMLVVRADQVQVEAA